jgi:hypothetical protein
MKRAIVAAGLLLLAGGAQAQTLHKGNLVGSHTVLVKLQPGVTLEQFADFYYRKVMPAYEASRPGWKAYPVRRIRGEKAEGLGLLIVIPTEADRDKYYNADGTDSELGKAANAKVQPLITEMGKLGTLASDVYVDLLVQ